MLNGVHVPDEGEIVVGGKPLAAHTPEAARAAGIAMNFQEMSLIPTLTVAQNIFLTREARDARGMIDDADSVRRAQAIFDMLQVEVDPVALVGDLGAGQKQLTEIAKAIAESPAFSIAGGGDTLAAIAKYGIEKQVGYISTGGGAFLEVLEGKTLPAFEILEKRFVTIV